MKTNTRIFYTIFLGTFGLAVIKNLYFYLRNKNEMEINKLDFMTVGALGGVYLGQISLGGVYVLFLGSIGIFYGYIYASLINFFVNRRRRRAEKIGIDLYVIDLKINNKI